MADQSIFDLATTGSFSDQLISPPRIIAPSSRCCAAAKASLTDGVQPRCHKYPRWASFSGTSVAERSQLTRQMAPTKHAILNLMKPLERKQTRRHSRIQ